MCAEPASARGCGLGTDRLWYNYVISILVTDLRVLAFLFSLFWEMKSVTVGMHVGKLTNF